jgi:hypothetical protein
MMDPGQKAFLTRHFEFKSWYGKSRHQDRVYEAIAIDDVQIRYWKLVRALSFEHRRMEIARTLWARRRSTEVFISIEQFKCSSIKVAHQTLLDILGDIESGAIQRDKTKRACGDVAFRLGESLRIFARANVVILIRNKGPMVVPVATIAKEFDKQLIRSFSRQKRQSNRVRRSGRGHS